MLSMTWRICSWTTVPKRDIQYELSGAVAELGTAARAPGGAMYRIDLECTEWDIPGEEALAVSLVTLHYGLAAVASL